MAVYNGGLFLRPAVDGILNQTYRDFEFVIVDDGSADNTGAILRSYDDPRLMLISNTHNLGQTRSLNVALRVSRGEFIARQDADDLSLPGRLEAQVRYLDAHAACGVVGTVADWIDEHGTVSAQFPTVFTNAEIQETLLAYCCVVHGTALIRREALEAIGYYNEDWVESQDYELWLRISEVWDIVNLAMVLYQYRVHSQMASVLHSAVQGKWANCARDEAIRRRTLRGLRSILELRPCLAYGTGRISRSWLSERYYYWALGCRLSGSNGEALKQRHNKRESLILLAIALALNPASVSARHLIHRLMRRAIGRYIPIK